MEPLPGLYLFGLRMRAGRLHGAATPSSRTRSRPLLRVSYQPDAFSNL